MPTSYIALRLTDLKRSTRMARDLPKGDLKKIGPGYRLTGSFEPADGDHLKVTSAVFQGDPLPGIWYAYAPVWKEESVGECRLATTAAADLLENFVSLGDDCEFSFAQRRVGAEPVEMLRFAGTNLDKLIQGFSEDFAAIGDPQHTKVEERHGETWIINTRYDIDQHLFDVSAKDLAKRKVFECQARARLRDDFLEDVLHDPDRILVFKSATASRDDVMRLVEAVRRKSQVRIMWAGPRKFIEPDGHVDDLSDGLIRASFGHFAPKGYAALPPVETWLKACQGVIDLSACPLQALAPPSQSEPRARSAKAPRWWQRLPKRFRLSQPT